MGRHDLRRATIGVIVALTGMAVLAARATHASVISDTPTLPLLDVPYTTTGLGCFPLAGVCVSGGTWTMTAPFSSIFNSMGQDITSTVLYSGTLTDLSNGPIG